MKSKYSIGLLTHNNVPRFRECISYIPYNKRVPFVVVNDGNEIFARYFQTLDDPENNFLPQDWH